MGHKTKGLPNRACEFPWEQNWAKPRDCMNEKNKFFRYLCVCKYQKEFEKDLEEDSAEIEGLDTWYQNLQLTDMEEFQYEEKRTDHDMCKNDLQDQKSQMRLKVTVGFLVAALLLLVVCVIVYFILKSRYRLIRRSPPNNPNQCLNEHAQAPAPTLHPSASSMARMEMREESSLRRENARDSQYDEIEIMTPPTLRKGARAQIAPQKIEEAIYDEILSVSMMTPPQKREDRTLYTKLANKEKNKGKVKDKASGKTRASNHLEPGLQSPANLEEKVISRGKTATICSPPDISGEDKAKRKVPSTKREEEQGGSGTGTGSGTGGGSGCGSYSPDLTLRTRPPKERPPEKVYSNTLTLDLKKPVSPSMSCGERLENKGGSH